MLFSTVLVVFLVQTSTLYTDGARILGVFPTPSLSHQVVFRALTLELARRGHEVVVITPNPALPKIRPPDNITEIDGGFTYQLMGKLMNDGVGQKQIKRGVMMDADALLSEEATRGLLSLTIYQLEMPQVKKLINDKTQKFDVLLVEAMGSYQLIMSHFFKAPVIQISSFYGCAENYETMGALAWHPIHFPNFYRTKFRNLTFWEHVAGVYLEWRIYWMVKRNEEIENELLKKNFGEDAPTVHEMKNNVHLLFLNAHPIFSRNRPVPPSVIYLGALHLEPVKELPEDLKAILDNSTRGVIYVSFGTNVRTGMMDAELITTLLDAFEALPYDILWKFDGGDLHRIPENLNIHKWFPQRDLLMHPNIKLFVTQGGLQSTDEAIDAGVPMVGIPMLGDQWYNVDKCVEMGISEHLDVLTITAQDLINAAIKVIENTSYRENMKRVQFILKEQPMSSLERAVWWTEHVINNKGVWHMRAPGANENYSPYHLIYIAMLVLVAVITIFILIFAVYKIF